MIKISKWSKKDEQFLIDNKDKPLAEVAKIINRSIPAIKDKRRKIGLKRIKINDLKGKRFDRYLVLREDGRLNRKVAWICKCDCGNIRRVQSTHLISGDSKSCGCLSRDLTSERNYKNLNGKNFSNLLVIKKMGRTKYQQVKWLCKCDCGNETIVVSSNLTNNNTESCGCKRTTNQKKGIAWENLINECLKFKFDKYYHHERLPNNKIPDFVTYDKKTILDAKRHDYLKIEECINKYSPYCDQIIFICMKKKRNNWKDDFAKNRKVKFWYPNDFEKWLPKKQYKKFLEEIMKIEIMSNDIKKKEYIDIHKAIEKLEKKSIKIKQETVAKEMGTGRNIFRENPDFSRIVKDYRYLQKIKEENMFICLIKEKIEEINENRGRLTFQGIAKLLLDKIQFKETKESGDQQLWTLTRKIMDNPNFKKTIAREQQKLDLHHLNIIKRTVLDLLKTKKTISIMEIRNKTGFPKNYLYSDEIKHFITEIINRN